MTDDLDGDQTNGTPESPNSDSSQGNGDSNSSFDAKKLQTAFEAITKKLDEVDQRSKALQGDKDRGVAQTKSEVAELKRKFAEIEKLKKSGLDEDGAFEELSFRDEVRSLKDQLSKLNPTQPQSAGNSESAAVDVAKVIKDYNLDGNDPEVISEILKKDFGSAIEAENAALKLAYRRANPTPPSIGAATTVVSTPTGSKMTEADAEIAYAKLATLLNEPTKNKLEIAKAKKVLNDNGYKT